MTRSDVDPAAVLAAHLRPGDLVAVADGAGAPLGLATALAEAARRVGGVRLLLGWCLADPTDLTDRAAFPEALAFMGGYALRGPIRTGAVRYLPRRIGAVPSLLRGPLRPDVVIAGLRPGPTGLTHGSEVAWLPAAVEAGARVLVEVNHGLPRAAAATVALGDVVVVTEVDRPPVAVPTPAPDEPLRRLGEHAARLIPEGSAVQVGPGTVGAAVLAALRVPVEIDSGVLTDAVVDLDHRGLLRGTPIGTYLVGTPELYAWADGREVLHRIEHTHDLGRLAARPLVAVNTALEVDSVGGVNVEGLGEDVVAGIGGHGDYAIAATRSAEGLSMVAVPTRRGGARTLVDELSAPTSTAYADVEVVVTEHGSVDLRTCSRRERRAALRSVWPED